MKIFAQPATPISMAILMALALPAVSHAQDAPPATPAEAAASEPVHLSESGLPPIWLQGEPVKEFAKGKLYIFEFWATWCGPCLQAMPHMEQLHQAIRDRKDVAIIGVNVMDATPSERLLPFLKSKKVEPTYALAADDGRDGRVSKNWLTPLGINGIPHALAVRDGIVLWRGHPVQLNVEVIEALSNPNYKPGEKKLLTKAEQAAAVQSVMGKVRDATAQDPAAGRALLVQLATEKKLDGHDLIAGYDLVFRMNVSANRLDEARTTVEAMVATTSDDRDALLNGAQWLISTEELEGRDTPLAIDFTDRLLAKNPDDIAAMDLKAAALFQTGDAQAAADLQQKAFDSTKLHAEIQALRNELKK